MFRTFQEWQRYLSAETERTAAADQRHSSRQEEEGQQARVTPRAHSATATQEATSR